MKGIHHLAIWTQNLERLRDFYTTFFNGKSNGKYVNSAKGFESYFISFGGETRIEIMSRTDIVSGKFPETQVGLTHFAFAFSSKDDVLKKTEELRSAGFQIAGEPRTSGDGYFESVVLDPDGNRLECVYDPNNS